MRAAEIGERGDRLDDALARHAIVLVRPVRAQRHRSEGGDLREQPRRQARRFDELPARPDMAEEMGDRRADDRIGEAGQDRRDSAGLIRCSETRAITEAPTEARR